MRLPLIAHASGEQIKLTGTIDQGIHESELAPEFLAKIGGSDPDSPVVRFTTEFEAPLLPGQVALFECESPDPHQRIVAAVAAHWEHPYSPVPPTDGEAPPDAP